MAANDEARAEVDILIDKTETAVAALTQTRDAVQQITAQAMLLWAGSKNSGNQSAIMTRANEMDDKLSQLLFMALEIRQIASDWRSNV